MFGAVIDPNDYMSEEAVLARWHMLSKRMLRDAALKGEIQFFDFQSVRPSKGRPGFSGGRHYIAEQIQAFIYRKFLRGDQCVDRDEVNQPSPPLQPPQTSHSRSPATISTGPIPTAAEPSMPAGMTPELAASVASRLALRIGKKQKRGSPNSSSPQPLQPAPRYPVLIKS